MSSHAVIRGDDRVRLKLKNISEDLLSKELMSEIGNFLMTSIKVRTSGGKDVDSKKFTGYSQRYKFLRSREGLPTDVVDLFFTGSMMSSMTFEAKKSEVRLFFLPTSDKRGMFNPEKAYYVNELRNFFSISDEDAEHINQMIRDVIRKNK